MTHGQISSSSIFNFLLVTSCHCSFSLSSYEHHACNSSSSSRTSSLMSLLSFSTALRLLFQLPFDSICHNLSCFPTAPANSVGHSLPPFSCFFHLFLPPVLGHCPFPARFPLFFTYAAVEVFLYTPTGTLSAVPSTFASCSLVHCLHCKFSGFFVPCFERFLAIGSCGMPDLHRCARVNFLPLGCRMCRYLVCDDVLRRDKQFFVWQ